MSRNLRRTLHQFYHQALLSPELMCLSCSRHHWGPAGGRCSEARRQDCLVFATHMLSALAPAQRPPAEPPGPPPAP
jgi:hypothetical protein